MYNSTCDNLMSLDEIQNEAMRICTGVFKSTPIANLNILTNAPQLSLRRAELNPRYYFKTKCYFVNPAYECVVNYQLPRRFTVEGPRSLPFIVRLDQDV